MRKVLTVGVFDLFHIGHLNLLKNAKKYGDYLIVAVHDDKHNIKNVNFVYSLEERIDFVSSIKFVDEVVIYTRVDLLVKDISFDCLVYGPDQNHEYFQKAFTWCNNNNKELVKIERTEGISSTMIRKIVEVKNV
jgi:glycerol-3-phosphate cytidylyltransferase